MAIGRKDIEELIRKMNEAENNRENLSVEERIERLDALSEPNMEIIRNGTNRGSREVERVGERILFTKIPDYHRDYNHDIIDPPFASFSWTIKGTVNGEYGEAHGCSIVEISEQGKAKSGWMYLNPAQKLFTSIFPQKQ